jgi:glycine/D-amino acid oxidase-like deaminating enzyme
VATHGIGYGAGAALAVVQLHSGHELHHLEPSFSDTDRLEDQEDLIGDFIDVAC